MESTPRIVTPKPPPPPLPPKNFVPLNQKLSSNNSNTNEKSAITNNNNNNNNTNSNGDTMISSSSNNNLPSNSKAMELIKLSAMKAQSKPTTTTTTSTKQNHPFLLAKKNFSALKKPAIAKTFNTKANPPAPPSTSTDFSLNSIILKKQQLRQKEKEELAKHPHAIFGVKLDENAKKIPLFIFKAIQYLEENIDTEGLFRVSGDMNEVKQFKEHINNGEDVDLSTCTSPHCISSLLKMYFRELPEPLFTFEFYDMFIAAQCVTEEQARFEKIRKIISYLPQSHRKILNVLFSFLHRVSEHSDVNKMRPANLAIVFAPNLLRPPIESPEIVIGDSPHANGLISTLISQSSIFFGENGEVVEEAEEVEEDHDDEIEEHQEFDEETFENEESEIDSHSVYVGGDSEDPDSRFSQDLSEAASFFSSSNNNVSISVLPPPPPLPRKTPTPPPPPPPPLPPSTSLLHQEQQEFIEEKKKRRQQFVNFDINYLQQEFSKMEKQQTGERPSSTSSTSSTSSISPPAPRPSSFQSSTKTSTKNRWPPVPDSSSFSSSSSSSSSSSNTSPSFLSNSPPSSSSFPSSSGPSFLSSSAPSPGSPILSQSIATNRPVKAFNLPPPPVFPSASTSTSPKALAEECEEAISSLKSRISSAAKNLEFEKAAKLRDKMIEIEKLKLTTDLFEKKKLKNLLSSLKEEQTEEE